MRLLCVSKKSFGILCQCLALLLLHLAKFQPAQVDGALALEVRIENCHAAVDVFSLLPVFIKGEVEVRFTNNTRFCDCSDKIYNFSENFDYIKCKWAQIEDEVFAVILVPATCGPLARK